MPDFKDAPKPEPDPPNAFSASFIRRIRGIDWPVSLSEGLLAGPWEVFSIDGEVWIVQHEAGELPFAVCHHRETAMMLAAILPAAGREPVYELVETELMTMFGDRGFESIARLNYDEEQILRPLHTAHCLLVSPESLAYLLLAAPPETVARAGLIMARLTEKLHPEPSPSDLVPGLEPEGGEDA